MEPRWKMLANSLGLLVLRLGAGGFMATHGWGKLQMLLAGKFDQFGSHLGLSSQLSLTLAVGAEFFCALLVMVGLLTRLAAIPIVFTMAVAAFVAHAGDPWSMEQAFGLFMEGKTKMPLSKEPAMLYLIPFLTLVFTGAGKVSLDELIWRGWRGRGAK